MRLDVTHELPAHLQRDLQRAKTLTRISLGFMVSAIVVMYLTLGSSQAMRAAWIEDLVSLLPPIAFLVAAAVRTRGASEEYPYGLHRSVSIGYLLSAMALFALGGYIVIESLMKLVRVEYPTIGSVTLFGITFWLGWLMIAALVYTIIPPVILGRMLLPLANNLNDKSLFAQAEMLKADWMTGAAAIVGILGIGMGLWWADAISAMIIGADVAHDGWSSLSVAVRELADGRPTIVDGSAADPLPTRIETELRRLDWVEDALVRVRNEGHVFFGEAFIVPVQGSVQPTQIEAAADMLKSLDWRLHEMSITPIVEIDVVEYEGRR